MFGMFLIFIVLWAFFRSHLRKLENVLLQWLNIDKYLLKRKSNQSRTVKQPLRKQKLGMEKDDMNDIHKWLDEQDVRISALPKTLTLTLAKLTPSGGNSPTQSWFRGPARFPLDTEWPKSNGKDMLFIGQFELQNLPENLWYGHGNKQGWLLFFMSLDGDKMVSKAIHTTALGPARLGPKSSDAAWHHVWGQSTQAWPDDMPAYLQIEVVNQTRESAADSWPNPWPSRTDPYYNQTAFLGGRRDVGAAYPLLAGYDVPLIQLPSDPKFGWNWHDTGPCYICAKSTDVDQMKFSNLCWEIEA